MTYPLLENKTLIMDNIMLANNARTTISYSSTNANAGNYVPVYSSVETNFQTDMSKDMTVRRIRTFSTSYGLKAGDRLQVYGVRV